MNYKEVYDKAGLSAMYARMFFDIYEELELNKDINSNTYAIMFAHALNKKDAEARAICPEAQFLSSVTANINKLMALAESKGGKPMLATRQHGAAIKRRLAWNTQL